MRFFVDTANLEQIRSARAAGFFSGITMNPVLLAKETRDFEKHAFAVLEIADPEWDISLEVRSGPADSMAEQARRLASWDRRVRIKLPATSEGLKAASRLVGKIPLNMTIVKSPAQGLLCLALAGKTPGVDMVLSVFCGRLRQAGFDWQETVKTLADRKGTAKILAASIKTPADLSDAIRAGADIITAPPDVYELALASPLVGEDEAAFDKPFQEGLQWDDCREKRR